MRKVLLLFLLGALAVSARADERPLSPPEQRAAAAYENQVQLNPDSAAAHNRYAEYLSDHGQLRSAITQWRLAQIIEPANAAISNSLGGAYLRMGQAADSAKQFQRAIDNAKDNPAYYYNLANVEFLLRRDLTAAWQIDSATLLNKALADYREASQLAPYDLEYARGYAETFYALSDPDWSEAQAAWKHVLVLLPQGDFAYLQLARVSLKRGDKLQARLFLDQIRDVRHDGLKRKLRQQADKL